MHHTPPKQRRSALTIFGEDHHALTQLVPEAMARQIKNLWESDDAQLLALTERSLLNELRRRDKTPDALDLSLRLRFWFEFERTKDEDPRVSMDMDYVLGRKCSKEKFYRFVITDPNRLAFILCPLASEEESIALHSTLASDFITRFLEKADPEDMTHVNKVVKIFEGLHQKKMQAQYRGRGQKNSDGEPGASSENSPLAERTPTDRLAALQARISEAKVIDE